MKKGKEEKEKLTKMGVKGLLIASFWMINLNNSSLRPVRHIFVRRKKMHLKGRGMGRGG